MEIRKLQPSDAARLEKLGFVPEAIFRDHLRDRRGKMQDLLLLCHSVEGNSAGLHGLDVEAARKSSEMRTRRVRPPRFSTSLRRTCHSGVA